jgi:hypothetical protein
MNGPDHYRKAEDLLGVVTRTSTMTPATAVGVIAAAQVHATLALAAATAFTLTQGKTDMGQLWRSVINPPVDHD